MKLFFTFVLIVISSHAFAQSVDETLIEASQPLVKACPDLGQVTEENYIKFVSKPQQYETVCLREHTYWLSEQLFAEAEEDLPRDS